MIKEKYYCLYICGSDHFDILHILNSSDFLDSKLEIITKFTKDTDTNWQVSRILNSHINSDKVVWFIQNLDKCGLLDVFMPELTNLKLVPQTNKKSSGVTNAYEHTLRVIEKTSSYGVFRWAGIYHDTGKYTCYLEWAKQKQKRLHFYGHEIYSIDRMWDFFMRFPFLFTVEQKNKITNLIRFHMLPLDYQRNPNWSDEAIERFVNKVGKDNVLDIIEFAIADKKASNDNPKFLEPLYELTKRAKQFI